MTDHLSIPTQPGDVITFLPARRWRWISVTSHADRPPTVAVSADNVFWHDVTLPQPTDTDGYAKGMALQQFAELPPEPRLAP